MNKKEFLTKYEEALKKIGLKEEEIKKELSLIKAKITRMLKKEKITKIIASFNIDEMLDNIKIKYNLNTKKKQKEKFSFKKFLQILENDFSNMSKKLLTKDSNQLIIFILELLLILFIIAILKVPFKIITSFGVGFFGLLFSPISIMLINVWTFIISLSYIVVSICLVLYFLKIVLLEEDVSIKSIKLKDKSVIANPLIKLISLLIAIPLFIILFVIAIAILFVLYFNLFQNVPYYGPLILLVGLLFVNIILIQILSNYIHDIKCSPIYKIISGVSLILLFTFGIAIIVSEIATTKYYKDSLPNVDYELKHESFETNLDGYLKIECEDCFENYEIIYDDSLKDKIVVEVGYYNTFLDNKFITSRNKIEINSSEQKYDDASIIKNVIKNLKNKEIYNYGLLYGKNLTIWVSEKNAKNISVEID